MTSAVSSEEILDLGKSGWKKYDGAVFNEPIYIIIASLSVSEVKKLLRIRPKPQG